MNHRFERVAVPLIGAFVLSAPTVGQAEVANETEIDAYLSSQVETTRVPGLVALVTDSEEIIYTHSAGVLLSEVIGVL